MNALLVIVGLLVKFESVISEVISYFNAGLYCKVRAKCTLHEFFR